jgi:hypothetical protein
MLSRSAAVVVATVTGIDPNAGNGAKEALTRVEIDVQDVVHGETPGGSKQSLLFRGGVLPDGMEVQYSNGLSLAAGEQYILFLRSEYYISPLLQAPGATLRVALLGGRRLPVNESGQALLASRAHGLIAQARVAASLEERLHLLSARPELAGKPESNEAPSAIAQASSLDQVVAVLRARGKSLGIKTGTYPLAPRPWPERYKARFQSSAAEAATLDASEVTP